MSQKNAAGIAAWHTYGHLHDGAAHCAATMALRALQHGILMAVWGEPLCFNNGSDCQQHEAAISCMQLRSRKCNAAQ